MIVSYKNLRPEILQLMKVTYPDGYLNNLMKIDKGIGEAIYVVPVETDDTHYLVKVDVKIDKLKDLDDFINQEDEGDNSSNEDMLNFNGEDIEDSEAS